MNNTPTNKYKCKFSSNECNKDNIKYKSTEGILDEDNNLIDV